MSYGKEIIGIGIYNRKETVHLPSGWHKKGFYQMSSCSITGYATQRGLKTWLVSKEHTGNEFKALHPLHYFVYELHIFVVYSIKYKNKHNKQNNM